MSSTDGTRDVPIFGAPAYRCKGEVFSPSVRPWPTHKGDAQGTVVGPSIIIYPQPSKNRSFAPCTGPQKVSSTGFVEDSELGRTPDVHYWSPTLCHLYCEAALPEPVDPKVHFMLPCHRLQLLIPKRTVRPEAVPSADHL